MKKVVIFTAHFLDGRPVEKELEHLQSEVNAVLAANPEAIVLWLQSSAGPGGCTVSDSRLTAIVTCP